MLRVWLSYVFAILIALQSVVAIADSHQDHQQQSDRLELTASHKLTSDSDFHDAAFSADSPLTEHLHSFPDNEREAPHPDCHHGHCHHPAQAFLSLLNEKFALNLLSQGMFETVPTYLSAFLLQVQRPPIA